MFISPHQFAHIEKLYDQSLYVLAYHAAQEIAPLEVWEGTTARILAGRIAATVGAPKLGRKQQLLAYRHDPDDWETRYYFARMILRYRGAVAAWQFLQQHDSDPTLAMADPKVHSDWLAFHAFVLAQLRDFERTEPWLVKAEQVAPNNVWVWVERAKVFELQTRYEDALSVLRYALILQPWFRPTIQTSAHALVLQGREEEALRLLAQASQHIECAWLVEQLAKLQIELGQFAEARQSLERFAALSPRMEPEILEQLNIQRAEMAYLSGDYPAAIAQSRQCTSHAWQQLAAKLEQGDSTGQRVILPVNATLPSHLTGVPATLATISQYYKIPAQHLGIVEEVGQDGTSAHNERKWALKNGYAVREFRVTWESAIELLKRKIVFTLTTVEAGKAQLQAVIGYDSTRQTLLVRAPAQQHHRELEAKKLVEGNRASGPRGMALIPAQHAKHLNSLPLPEADLYDHLYKLQEALHQHDRAQANHIYQAMQQRFDGQRLTWQAKLTLARYDGEHRQMLACAEKLAELFPEDIQGKLRKAHCLRVSAHRNQRLAYLQKICAQKAAAPLLWQEYARALGEDARQAAEASRWIRKAWQHGVVEAAGVHLLATMRWQQQRRAEAVELFRFAACLDDKDEALAQSFFRAAHQLGQTEVALEFLHHRLPRGETGQRLQTLVQSLAQVGKQAEAWAALTAGLEKLPADGKLKLFAAEMYARHGSYAQATSLLDQARTPTLKHEWLRTAATIALLRGQKKEALQHWGAAAPFSCEAQQQAAQLLAETDSPQAAIEFLREGLRRFPFASKLRELLIERLRHNPALAESELRLLLKYDTANDGAYRTLAAVLLELRRNEEALTASEIACRISPANAENHCTRGQALAQASRHAEAKEAFRTALTCSAEHTASLVNLVAAAATALEQRDALLFVLQEIRHQASAGEGLLTFRTLTKDRLEPTALLQHLQATLQQRPDLPQAWSAVIAQLLEIQHADEAYSLACQATERFPLLAHSWLDLGLVYEAKADFANQCNALQRALLLAPDCVPAIQKLAAACERLEQLPQARVIIERAITYSPFDHHHHLSLADVWWKLGEPENALLAMQRALSLEPDSDWGWRMLRTWSEQTNQPALALQAARTLTEQCPGDPRVWLTLARALNGNDALSALDRAIQLNPRLTTAHSLRASLLAEAGRYDEALRACRPTALAPFYPAELLCAEATITAQCGDLQLALKRLRAVLKDEPNYAPGWDQLARWCRRLEQEKEYLEAAQNLARLLPQSSAAHGQLGEAQLRNGDRDGAKESFHRALALAPDYEFAGLALFDLHIADNNLRGASEVLRILTQAVSNEALTLRALKLAIKLEDRVQVQQQLVALCLSPTSLPTQLDSAVEALAPTKLSKLLDTVFEEVLAQPETNSHVGKLWAERCALQNRPDHCLKRLHQMSNANPGQLWQRAATTFLEICARNGAAEHVQKFIRKYRELLRQETASWGIVGAALYQLGDTQAMVDWMNDWQQRPGIVPEMLWNLALALRDLNREDEARAVGLHAVTLPADDRTYSHLALLALDEALAGRIRAADQHAARIAPQALNEWDQVMLELATGLREFHAARAEGRAIGQTVIDKLMQLAQQTPWLKQSRTLVNLFKRAIDNVLTNENDSLLKVKTKLKMKWFEYRAN